MIKQAVDTSLGQLLSSDNNVVCTIPPYQREYVWGRNNWENLFDDLEYGDDGHFLGSIIVIDHGFNSKDEMLDWEVVDGQQRLTTVSILLVALYEKLKEHSEDLDDDGQYELNSLKRRLLRNKGTKMRLIPQRQGDNFDDYQSLLSEYVGLPAYSEKAKNAGNRRIYKAFRYFCSRIDEKITEDGNAAATTLALLRRVISAVVVQISVSSQSDAYVLFESLNNRGVPLTAVDLIKNSLLANIGSDKDEQELCFKRWQQMLEMIGDEYTAQERFFRQNYDAFRRVANKPFAIGQSKFPLGNVATKSSLLSIYEQQIKRSPRETLDFLCENAKVYAKIISPSDNAKNNLDVSLWNLARVQGVSSYLLLMNLIKNRASLELADDDVAIVCQALVKFFVRRNLTDTPPTRDLVRLFISITEGIEDDGKRGSGVVEYIHDRLVKVSASDDRFREALEGPIYDANSDVARFILASLAQPSVSKEMKDLWERYPSGSYVWTIEHVFPQGSNIPSEWVEMVSGGDREAAKEIQDRCVHTLGNLTLTGYNSKLSNLSFEEKKNRKDSEGNWVGYRNGLNINEFIVASEKWNESRIGERTERLVEAAMREFAL